MQQVSDEVKALLALYSKITLGIYVDGQKLTVGIGKSEYAAACGDTEEFSFGNACAARMTIPISASRPDLKDKSVQITWAVNENEHPLLAGKIDKAKVSGGRTTLEIWDDMYFGGSEAFVPTDAMGRDIDAADAFSGVASLMGVSAEPETLEKLAGITITGGLSCLRDNISNSTVAGYIAGLIGGNAAMTRDGHLAVRTFRPTDYHTAVYQGGAVAEDDVYTVTGVTFLQTKTVVVNNEDGTVSETEEIVEYVAGDGSLVITNPLADQAAADRAYAALKGVSIRPGAYSFPQGILLEPGDLLTVVTQDGDYSVAAVSLRTSFDGGARTDLACGGASAGGGATGPLNQALKSLIADFAKFRSLVAENATITSARIDNLNVGDIFVDSIIQSADDGETFYLDLVKNILRMKAMEDLQTKVDDNQTATEKKITEVSVKADGVSAEVSQQTQTMENLREDVAAIQAAAGEVAIRIQSIEDNGVSKVKTSMGYTFDDEGMHVEKEGDEVGSKVTNRGVYVARGSEVMLQADASGVKATDVTVNNYLILAHTRYEEYDDGIDADCTAAFDI